MRKLLTQRRSLLTTKQVTVGFDGFLDRIARPIRDGNNYFETIAQFGEYLMHCGEKSCSIELDISSERIGGNMPLLARGIGCLGIHVNCVGMIDDTHFSDMPECCELLPIASPGSSTALEFCDGKVMLMPRVALDGDPWQRVLSAVPDFIKRITESDLVALVNWSELDFSQSLWKHTYEECLAPFPEARNKYAFFDLCDCSRKSASQLSDVLNLIGRFSNRRFTVLSLNENEAGSMPVSEDKLCEIYGIDEVLVHTLHKSTLYHANGKEELPTNFVANPILSTGAGDNFNAASCAALLLGLNLEQRLKFANAFAHFYITKGYSPSFDEILAQFEE